MHVQQWTATICLSGSLTLIMASGLLIHPFWLSSSLTKDKRGSTIDGLRNVVDLKREKMDVAMALGTKEKGASWIKHLSDVPWRPTEGMPWFRVGSFKFFFFVQEQISFPPSTLDPNLDLSKVT